MKLCIQVNRFRLSGIVLSVTILLSACSSDYLVRPLTSIGVVAKAEQKNVEEIQRQRNIIIQNAKNQLDRAYRWGGKSPAQGFDCSGLVFYAHNKAGIKIPRISRRQFAQAQKVSLNALQPGDLVFFKIRGNTSHVGIYIGERQFIHAPSPGKRVSRVSLDSDYWRRRLYSAGHFYQDKPETLGTGVVSSSAYNN